MSLYKSLFIIFIGSLLFAQRFDSTTGEVIELDSLKVKFNPETGKTFDFNTIPPKEMNSLENWEVKDLARRHAVQNYKEEKLIYIAMYGPVALTSILPTTLISMYLGEHFFSKPVLGYAIGSFTGIFLNPIFFASLDSKPQQLLLLQKKIKDLNDYQKNLYIKEYSKHLISFRVQGILKGEVLSVGAVIASLFFFTR